MIEDTLVEAPEDDQAAKRNVSAYCCLIRASVCDSSDGVKALIRDGFRCAVSESYDAKSVEHVLELQRQALDSKSPAKMTQCAHIFPESINQNIATESGAKLAKVEQFEIQACFHSPFS